jgi:uncharacterized protein (DUF2062 family)
MRIPAPVIRLCNGGIAGRLAGWLKEGLSPERLALTIALGFVLGVCPIFGVPTLLCTLAAAVLRLNLPAVLLVNYLVYPLQIALLWPFARTGAQLLGAVRLSRAWGAAGSIGTVALHATAAWVCFAVPAGLLVYFAARRLLRWRHAASQA